MQVSFGKGKHNWKNYGRGELQTRLRAETKRFGSVMRWISRLEFLSIFVSIDFVLRKFRFSDDFRFRMVFPLVALFFGTGERRAYNQWLHSPKINHACLTRIIIIIIPNSSTPLINHARLS